MTFNIYVLVAQCPLDGDVDQIIGPFSTPEAAEEGRALLFEAGGHPDAVYDVVQLTSLATHLAEIRDDLDDDDL